MIMFFRVLVFEFDLSQIKYKELWIVKISLYTTTYSVSITSETAKILFPSIKICRNNGIFN